MGPASNGIPLIKQTASDKKRIEIWKANFYLKSELFTRRPHRYYVDKAPLQEREYGMVHAGIHTSKQPETTELSLNTCIQAIPKHHIHATNKHGLELGSHVKAGCKIQKILSKLWTRDQTISILQVECE